MTVREMRFESSVISYGSETDEEEDHDEYEFESSVISYGSETSQGKI